MPAITDSTVPPHVDLLVAGRGVAGGLYRVDASQAVLSDAVDDLAALCEHPSLPIVYGVSASGSGALLVWKLDGDSVERLATAAIGSDEACHVAVSPDATVLVAVAYGGREGGVLRVWCLDPEGVPIGEGEVIGLQGASGVDAERQDAPHPHQAVFLGDTVLVPDLGADLVRRFRVARGALTEMAGVEVPPGTGPRHLVVLEEGVGDGALVAVSGELSSTVLVGRVGGSGTRWGVAPSTALSVDAHESNYPSDIAASPDGTRVYLANRGVDTVAVFDVVDEAPVPRAALDTGAAWPQHLLVSHDLVWVAWWHSSMVSVTTLIDGVPDGSTRSFTVPEPGWLLRPSHLG